jgi:hypothetical protein
VTVRQLALRPACTARAWHSELERREPFAPRCRLWPTADQCAGACLLAIPIEARFSMRPFALQFRELASRPIPATASTFPAYIFETILRSDPARSAPHSRPRSVFCDLARRDQHAKPVAVPDPGTHDSSSNISSPPGSLDPSGSKLQSDVRTMKLTLAGRPIFLPSPRRGNNFTHHSALRIIGPDPLLPARLAVLRTSWNHSHHAPKQAPRQ